MEMQYLSVLPTRQVTKTTTKLRWLLRERFWKGQKRFIRWCIFLRLYKLTHNIEMILLLNWLMTLGNYHPKELLDFHSLRYHGRAKWCIVCLLVFKVAKTRLEFCQFRDILWRSNVFISCCCSSYRILCGGRWHFEATHIRNQEESVSERTEKGIEFVFKK